MDFSFICDMDSFEFHLCSISAPAFLDNGLFLLFGKSTPGGRSSGSRTNVRRHSAQTPFGNPAEAILREGQRI